MISSESKKLSVGYGLDMTIDELRQLLNPLDTSPTECDGMTRLCHTVLCQHDIPHQIYCGTCRVEAQLIPLHFWIDLAKHLQGWRVDYRLRMWVRNSERDIPRGVFHSAAFSQVCYQGKAIEMPPLPDSLFRILLLDPKQGERECV